MRLMYNPVFVSKEFRVAVACRAIFYTILQFLEVFKIIEWLKVHFLSNFMQTKYFSELIFLVFKGTILDLYS